MHHNYWAHAAGVAARKNGKGAGIVLIVIGFFLAPILIGIPLIMLGAYKIGKG